MRRLPALLLAAAALLNVGAPAAQATCGPDQGPFCYVECLRPPFIDTKDLPATVHSIVADCPV
jgi:hypothetical protein